MLDGYWQKTCIYVIRVVTKVFESKVVFPSHTGKGKYKVRSQKWISMSLYKNLQDPAMNNSHS